MGSPSRIGMVGLWIEVPGEWRRRERRIERGKEDGKAEVVLVPDYEAQLSALYVQGSLAILPLNSEWG